MQGTQGDFETALELCRARHCRIVLATILLQDRSLTLRDLTSEIVERDRATSQEDSQSVFLSLHHAHIPKLADVGVVEYDAERHIIEPGKKLDQLRSHLSTILEADPELDYDVAERR